MITVGSLYSLIPRLYRKEAMHSVPLINLHFWLATIGIVLYTASMWIAGLMQGLMWRAVNDDGTLTYTFIESIAATFPYYVGRFAGGSAFLIGMLIMAYNVWKTVKEPAPVLRPAMQAAA
jgi:cytochrome c oxidase cbb3-type subunit 1